MTILLSEMHNTGDDDLYRSIYDQGMQPGNHLSHSDPPENAAILVISAPGFRQDSLLAILSSDLGSPVVLCANTIAEAEEWLRKKKITLVVIDHTLERGQMLKAIQRVRKLDQKAWILQLAAHPRDVFNLEEPLPDTVLCDGFSSMDLFFEIQKIKLNLNPPQISMGPPTRSEPFDSD
jgi:hypothetical protein